MPHDLVVRKCHYYLGLHGALQMRHSHRPHGGILSILVEGAEFYENGGCMNLRGTPDEARWFVQMGCRYSLFRWTMHDSASRNLPPFSRVGETVNRF